jgi:hypothetical protein
MRGRFVASCSLLAVGGLLVLLSGGWRNRALSPGPLAGHHAQLLSRNGTQANCAACHDAANRSVAGWGAALLAREGAASQSHLCMNCHKASIRADLPLAPHNVPPASLAESTRAHKTNEYGTMRRVLNAAFSPSEEIACASCHREHHGAHADLAAVDDAACQTCHQQQFASFAKDHPDFGKWPHERRTRIVFNHASHRGKHFAEKRQTFDCRQCHLDDATGDVQLLASYETACAACHDEKIATSVANGVPMLALPMLDVAALKSAGHDIGEWPKNASGDFDGRMPPMMKLLVAADVEAASAIDKLGPDFEFLDVDPDDREQLAAAATIAAAIKDMLTDLSQRGPGAVRERLSKVLGRDVAELEVDALLAGMSSDTVRSATSKWLADSDVGNGKRGQVSATANRPTNTTNSDAMYSPAGRWTHDDATFAIRYTPAAHADPVLTAWLKLLAGTPNVSEKPIAASMFKELAKATAPGLCISCHSVEQADGGTLTINWRGFDRSREPRSFTRFSHGPHVLLPQLADCTTCHAIDSAADTTASYADLNPRHFTSEFKTVSKRQCAECHTRTASGDRCQSCHNYHVDGASLGAR